MKYRIIIEDNFPEIEIEMDEMEKVFEKYKELSKGKFNFKIFENNRLVVESRKDKLK